jgi:cytochrome oxidase Cu insertion factor (SCO1/SenC/PrrC family)
MRPSADATDVPKPPPFAVVSLRSSRLRVAALALVGVAAAAVVVALIAAHGSANPAARGSRRSANQAENPGIPISGRAPDFTLTDQFGRQVSLHEARGKVTILAFIDPECTTVCPLTTTAMVEAKALLGSAASHVQLLGVGANPTATAVKDVRAYSESHGMMQQWRFLTAPLPRLKRVWAAYGIKAQLVHGQIDHTAALFVIDARGRLSRLYPSSMTFTGVPQLGHQLALSAAALLPAHPRVRSLGNARIQPIAPTMTVSLPRANGGRVRFGPGAAHVYLFWGTWTSEVTGLSAALEALDRYQQAAARDHLPSLVAVDVASVEPSPGALPRFLRGLPHPLSYPVAVDQSGRLADGYRVQDQPWLELVSARGRFLWYDDVSTSGWPSTTRLLRDVRAALARASKPRGR